MANATLTTAASLGYDPNASIAGEVIAVTTTFLVLEVLATVARSVARHIINSGFMWSDVYMPVSLLFNIALCTTAYLGVRWGTGKHTIVVPKTDQINNTINTTYGVSIIYNVAVILPKLAILDLYLKVFIDRFSRWTSYLVGFVLIASAVVNVVTTYTQCTPFSQPWDPVPGGHCDDIAKHYSWAALPNVVTDVIMLILPIPGIWRLRLSWKMKLGLTATFSVGGLGLATSAVRFDEFLGHALFLGHSSGGTDDATWNDAIIFVWVIVECGVYHLCACSVTFRPLSQWLFRKRPRFSIVSRILRSGSTQPKRMDASNSDQSSASVSKIRGSSLVPWGAGVNECTATSDVEAYPVQHVDGMVRVTHDVTVSASGGREKG